MLKSDSGNVKTPGFPFLRELCRHICKGLPEEKVRQIYRSAVTTVIQFGSLDASSEENLSISDKDEVTLCDKIETQIRSLDKNGEVSKFHQLHRKLMRSEAQSVLTNRYAVLSFLLQLSEGRNKKKIKEPLFERRKMQPRAKLTATAFKGGGDGMVDKGVLIGDPVNAISSSITVRPTSFANHNQAFFKKGNYSPDNMSSEVNKGRMTKEGVNSFKSPGSSDSLSLMSASPRFLKSSKMYASESTVLTELVYCFQGVPGNVLKMDLQHGFIVDPQVRIHHASVVERLIELGHLHNKVLHLCKSLGKGGSVAQAVEAGIKKQLTDYYGLVGCIHSELMQNAETLDVGDDTPLREEGYGTESSGGRMTLRRLLVWATEPVRRLQTLCDAALSVSDHRGGSILSALTTLADHGDPRYNATIHFLVAYAGKPLMNMIRNWMVEGELFDPYDEFFVTVNTNCQDRDIWQDKFILRPTLIPNIITRAQADMILMSGKAVHFLNVICDQRVPVTGMRQKLKELNEIDVLQLTDQRSELSTIVAAIFEETSKLVLATLVKHFKLFQHFQGLRRYILLGRGDFANYFMELVEPEMRKPACRLQYHELTGLLGCAIRSSSAAHDEPDIIKRVSVKLLVASNGDCGSDVFGLQYNMHHPLDAAFGLNDGAYSHMFNFLWRTKRMEYILLSLRRERWATKNKLNWLATQVPEVNNVLVLADRLSQELVHFARQFHYYILFEVVECLWEKFSNSLQKATSLDEVISAHNIFIRDIQIQTFQDETSRKFINELRLIWNLVFELETLERQFLQRVDVECEERNEREKKIISEGTNYKNEYTFQEKNREFKCFLSTTRAQYSIITTNYEDVLKKFLLELSLRKDHQLRLLSARIDYNEHYKKNDSRIYDSMKFSRCSDLFE